MATTNVTTSRTARLLKEFISTGLFPGTSALVLHKGEPVLAHAEGLVRVEPPMPATTDNIWAVASISKPVATTALMQQVEQGKVGLEQRVVDFVPEFGPDKEPVLVRHLLTHTSGVTDFPSDAAIARLGLIPAMGAVPLQFEPGTRVSYCTATFELVKAIVQGVSGQDWLTYTHEHLFAPLAMNTSSYYPRPEWGDRLAPVYDLENSTDNWANSEENWGYQLAGGGLFSTLQDLARFGQAFVEGGKGLILPETYKQMTTLQTEGLLDVSGVPVSWGLGWYLNRDDRPTGFGRYMSARAFGHGGATGTRLAIDPDNEVVVVFLGNKLGYNVTESGRFESAITDAAMQDLGLTAHPRY